MKENATMAAIYTKRQKGNAQDVATGVLYAEAKLGGLLKPLSETSHGGSFGGSKKVLPEGISRRQSHYAQELENHWADPTVSRAGRRQLPEG